MRWVLKNFDSVLGQRRVWSQIYSGGEVRYGPLHCGTPEFGSIQALRLRICPDKEEV